MLWVKTLNYKICYDERVSRFFQRIYVYRGLFETEERDTPWGFPAIQSPNDLAVKSTQTRKMKDLGGFPSRNCMFLIGMYMKLHADIH